MKPRLKLPVGYKLVPNGGGVPDDLPPWARDELVRRRIAMSDLRRENLQLRVELAKARGEDVDAVLLEDLKRTLDGHGQF